MWWLLELLIDPKDFFIPENYSRWSNNFNSIHDLWEQLA